VELCIVHGLNNNSGIANPVHEMQVLLLTYNQMKTSTPANNTMSHVRILTCGDVSGISTRPLKRQVVTCHARIRGLFNI